MAIKPKKNMELDQWMLWDFEIEEKTTRSHSLHTFFKSLQRCSYKLEYDFVFTQNLLYVPNQEFF